MLYLPPHQWTTVLVFVQPHSTIMLHVSWIACNKNTTQWWRMSRRWYTYQLMENGYKRKRAILLLSKNYRSFSKIWKLVSLKECRCVAQSCSGEMALFCCEVRLESQTHNKLSVDTSMRDQGVLCLASVILSDRHRQKYRTQNQLLHSWHSSLKLHMDNNVHINITGWYTFPHVFFKMQHRKMLIFVPEPQHSFCSRMSQRCSVTEIKALEKHFTFLSGIQQRRPCQRRLLSLTCGSWS